MAQCHANVFEHRTLHHHTLCSVTVQHSTVETVQHFHTRCRHAACICARMVRQQRAAVLHWEKKRRSSGLFGFYLSVKAEHVFTHKGFFLLQ